MELHWSLERAVWACNILARATVIWRLYSVGLDRKYRYFLVGFALTVGRSLALFPFLTNTIQYYWIWLVTEPAIWALRVFIVLELYSLVLGEYRGIQSASRRFLYAAVSASVVLSGLAVLATVPGRPPGPRPAPYYFFLFERGLNWSLALFLLLLLTFVVWFAVPLNRNLLLHASTYVVFFFADNFALLYWHLFGASVKVLTSSAMMLVGIACMLVWTFGLSRQGEQRTGSLHLGRSVEYEKRLLTRLDSLNATLLRTARK